MKNVLLLSIWCISMYLWDQRVIADRSDIEKKGQESIDQSVFRNSLSCKKPYYWLHIPKTSSTFCLSLQHLCCPEAFRNITKGVTLTTLLEHEILEPKEKFLQISTQYGCAYLTRTEQKGSSLTVCPIKNNHHRPLPPQFDLANPVFVMLRDPTNRLISSFLDSQHHEGMQERYFQELKGKMSFHIESNDAENELEDASESPRTIQKLVHAAKVYMTDPALRGCQTKMILGYECADSQFLLPDPYNDTYVQLAIEKLHHFSFVGILEEYSKSIELIHAISGRGTTPTVVELVPIRSGDHIRAAILKKYLAHFVDPYDQRLYEEGKRLFLERYRRVVDGI